MNISSLVAFIRNTRKLHKIIGLSIGLLIIISSVSGILLAFKKQSEFIQPSTQRGIETNSEAFVSVDQLMDIAICEIEIEKEALIIDRLDIRPNKGIAKVLFKDLNWEMQIDLSSGKVLSQKARYSDLIERIHDGSIISESFKLLSMSSLGLGLLILSFSGLSLWYGPKLIKNKKNAINT